MSNFLRRGTYEPLTHFPPRERKNSSIPIKSRKKLLKSLGICGFLFLLICLLHTRNWLLFGSHVIPRLSLFSPLKSRSALIFAPKMMFLSRKLHNFCSIFVVFSGFEEILWFFLKIGRDSCLIFERIFYIFYYILYILYIIPIYLFISNILLFQQYTKIKNRFLLNSLILPQKFLFHLNPAIFSSKISIIEGFLNHTILKSPQF